MWIRQMEWVAVVVLVVFGCIGRSADAVVIDSANGLELDVEYSAGTGPFESFLVIDFSEHGGDSVAFSYLHDGSQTSLDMLNDVSAAGDLAFDFSVFDFGGGPIVFVDNFTYQANVGNDDFFSGGGWRFELGTLNDPSIDWTTAGAGVSDRVLTDGSFDGWYNTFDNANTPNAPLRPIGSGGAASVPEPASAVLIGVGLAGLFARRR